MAFVYILKDEVKNKHYIGSCVDLNIRLARHLNHTGGTTTKYGNYKLICYNKYNSLDEARRDKKLIKSYKGGNSFKKLLLGWSKAHTPLSGASC